MKKKDVSETLKGPIQIWRSAKVGRHKASHPFMLDLTKDIVEHLLEFIADGDLPYPFDSVDIHDVILAAVAYAASKVQQQRSSFKQKHLAECRCRCSAPGLGSQPPLYCQRDGIIVKNMSCRCQRHVVVVGLWLL